MYTATYSPDDNKLRLYASSRLPKELYERVRAAGFIWAPKQDLFVAPMWTTDREDLLIELCGEIGDEDTSLVDRAEQRADRFEVYSDKRAADADRARDAVSAIADNIPFGQPILVGHHSEKHARRDAEKIDNGMRKAVRMWETSKYWTRRAEGAIRHAKYKERPDVRARRIKKIQADLRRVQRSVTESNAFLKLWRNVENNSPQWLTNKGTGVPATPHECALFIADRDYFHIRAQDTSAWSALDKGLTDWQNVQRIAIDMHERNNAGRARWIAHYENRLAYERAMLEEQGAADLLKPKPRPVQLPLCNYRAPNGIDIQNIYNRGELMHYPQVEMTRAEYAKIYNDYKGTRVVDNSHRVRTAMLPGHKLVSVFLTDAPIHEKPTPGAPPKPREVRLATFEKPEPDAKAKEFAAMKEQLRGGGVKVVSVPNLFPTPPELAARMVELAEIQDGQDVLEPSAGTGRIVDAIRAQDGKRRMRPVCDYGGRD
jgi:hypothetical protein